MPGIEHRPPWRENRATALQSAWPEPAIRPLTIKGELQELGHWPVFGWPNRCRLSRWSVGLSTRRTAMLAEIVQSMLNSRCVTMIARKPSAA
jgi:hypothetical protein